MKIYDITRDLSGDTIIYPGDIRPRFHEIDTGQYRVTEMTLGSHTGTHIDAPSHYIEGGQTVDRIPLDRLIGPARVLDCSDVEEFITYDQLNAVLPPDQVSSDQIEDVMSALNDMGVNIVEHGEDSEEGDDHHDGDHEVEAIDSSGNDQDVERIAPEKKKETVDRTDDTAAAVKASKAGTWLMQ